MFNRPDVEVKRPYNAHSRSNIVKLGGLEAFLKTIRRDCEPDAGILVLLDAERENVHNPHALVTDLNRRAQQVGLPFPVEVTCAVCEYESWFLASLESIRSKFKELDPTITFDGDPEQECNAKEWITEHMPHGRAYKETTDQARLTTWLDLRLAHIRSDSFRMFVSAVERLIA